MNTVNKIIYLTFTGFLFISSNARAEALPATAYLNMLFDKDVENTDMQQIQSRQNLFSQQNKTKISDIVLSFRNQTFGEQKQQKNIQDIQKQYNPNSNSAHENQKWHDLADKKRKELKTEAFEDLRLDYYSRAGDRMALLSSDTDYDDDEDNNYEFNEY